MLDLPAAGCAKSRLIGTHAEPCAKAGSSTPLMDREEQIGVVLRTRDAVNPIFVSIGHRTDLPTAIALARSCCTRYRLPEPTRLADRLSKF
jgi:deoxyribonuclease V